MNQNIIFGSGASANKDFDGTLDVCHAAIENGIRMFDTAPSYHTEAVLSKAVAMAAKDHGVGRKDYFMQTKIDPIQMYEGRVEEYFKSKLQEMRFDYVDSLLIHWPVWQYFDRTWEALLKLREQGYTKRIGICNLRLRHLKSLKSRGVMPEILQIERHPLCTFEAERQFCCDNGIMLQDYSPLCKMHPLIAQDDRLQRIAAGHGKDIGQIVLKWHIQTGAVPVFTSKKPSRVASYAHLDDFMLSGEELSVIQSLNCNHKLYLESLICPAF